MVGGDGSGDGSGDLMVWASIILNGRTPFLQLGKAWMTGMRCRDNVLVHLFAYSEMELSMISFHFNALQFESN